MAFTESYSYWCLSKSVGNKLYQQTVVFIVTVNQDKIQGGILPNSLTFLFPED